MPRDVQPPSSIEAEQALLGAILLNNEALDKLPSGFGAEMFHDPVHGKIFDLARTQVQEGRLVSPVTLKPFLAGDEGLEKLGGPSYLSRLAGAAISVSTAKDYAAMIRDLWARRSGVQVLEDAQIRLADLEGSPHEALDAAQTALATLSASTAPKPLIHGFSAALASAANQTQRGYHNDGKPLISTGLQGLDAIIGGIMPADHIVLMGESSMGKTAIALNLARKVAAQGHAVFIASLEMPSDQIAQRMVSQELAARRDRIEYLRLMTGRVSEDEFKRALMAMRDMEREPITFAEDDAATLPRLMAAAMAARRSFEKTETPLGLVVVDYLQLVQVPGVKTATEMVGAAARAMKTLAKTLGCAVVSLSQMNQENKARDDKRPRKGDARQSGEIEHAADVMLGCYRHAYYLERDIQGCTDAQEKSEMIEALSRVKNRLELITLKNRRGALKTAYAYCDLPVNVLEDDAPDTQEAMAF